MLRLRSSPASPFGRKVKIDAMVTGVWPLFTVENADTLDPNDSLRRENPLGKIPCLVLPDGRALYDSRVIVDFVDQLSGGRLVPTGAARFEVLALQALADGIMDAAILQRYEIVYRDEAMRSAKWLDHQRGKVARGLTELAARPPGTGADAGTIALACALGYLDFRFDGRWRHEHPALVAWLDAFAAAYPAFDATRPPPA